MDCLDKRRPQEQGAWGGFWEEGDSVRGALEPRGGSLEPSQAEDSSGATLLEGVWGVGVFSDRPLSRLQGEASLGREVGSWGALGKQEGAYFRPLSVSNRGNVGVKLYDSCFFIANLGARPGGFGGGGLFGQTPGLGAGVSVTGAGGGLFNQSTPSQLQTSAGGLGGGGGLFGGGGNE